MGGKEPVPTLYNADSAKGQQVNTLPALPLVRCPTMRTHRRRKYASPPRVVRGYAVSEWGRCPLPYFQLTSVISHNKKTAFH